MTSGPLGHDVFQQRTAPDVAEPDEEITASSSNEACGWARRVDQHRWLRQRPKKFPEQVRLTADVRAERAEDGVEAVGAGCGEGLAGCHLGDLRDGLRIWGHGDPGRVTSPFRERDAAAWCSEGDAVDADARGLCLESGLERSDRAQILGPVGLEDYHFPRRDVPDWAARSDRGLGMKGPRCSS